ncbi:MAG: hypothetical protein NT038_08645 [Euryarchaeota archaeon]|nr:hypothetical protein [Euryarchaeota archaeon]
MNLSETTRTLLTTFILLILPWIVIVLGLVFNVTIAWFFYLTITWFGFGVVFFAILH